MLFAGSLLGRRDGHDGLNGTSLPVTGRQVLVPIHNLGNVPKPDGRPRLRAIYTAEIGVREATGSNDGERVEEYLRYCNLGPGHAWCAAFVSWCFGQAGYGEPRNPWSPALFPSNRVVWSKSSGVRSRAQSREIEEQRTRGKDTSWFLVSSVIIPRQGDVFGIYYTNLRRIGHVGFVDGWDGKYGITVEGNTGPDPAIREDGSPANPIRAGPSTDGVYRKRRPIRTIYAVADWINDPS